MPREYSKSLNTAELHIKINPKLLFNLKRLALQDNTSLGELVRTKLSEAISK